MKIFPFALALIPLSGVLPSPAQAQTAEEIMGIVRSRQTRSHAEVTGYLRTGPKKVPFKLQLDGSLIRYQFTEPPRTIQLQLGAKGSTLEEITGDGAAKKVSPARWDEKLYDSDVTLEDLSLQFFYWPNPELKGTEKIMSRPAWKIQLQAPDKRSQYSNVLLWIDKESGAFTQAEGYGWNGKLARTFKVISAQQLKDTWFLKEMRVQTPGNSTPTYLRINKED